MVCAGSSRPAERHTRTAPADAAPRRHRTAPAHRSPQAAARAPTAARARAVSRAARHGPASRHARAACASPGRLPDVSATTLGGLSQTDQEVCQDDRPTPSTLRCVLEGASWRPRALDDPSRARSGLRSGGGALLPPAQMLATKSCCNAALGLICSKRNQCHRKHL